MLLSIGLLFAGFGGGWLTRQVYAEKKQADFQKMLMSKLADLEKSDAHHKNLIEMIYDVAGYDIPGPHN